MRCASTVIATVTAILLLWHECQQHLAVFCYLIVCRGLAVVRPARMPVLAPHIWIRPSLRKTAACRPSFTFSTLFMTRKGSGN